MKIHYLEQGTQEWHKLRKGRMTASEAQKIQTAKDGLNTYTDELVAEMFAEGIEEEYSNPNMERGKALEDEARTIFELEKNLEVKQVGFIELNEYVGCSPDGIIMDSDKIVSGVEFKCPTNKVYAQQIIKDKIDSKYLWQIQFNMYVTGSKRWYYVAYNPNFPKSMYIKLIEANEEAFAKIQDGIRKGIKLLEEKRNKLQEFMLDEIPF